MTVTNTKILHVESGEYEDAEIISLDPDMARELIDNNWWANVPKDDQDFEKDGHWIWEEKLVKRAEYIYYDFLAIKSKRDRIEGAMIYLRADQSDLDASKYCGYIDYLATAPWNRTNLVAKPTYKGIGSVFMMWAINRSKQTGLKGRIKLVSLPTKATRTFYENRGFIRTNLAEPEDGLINYELPEAAAQEALKRGWI